MRFKSVIGLAALGSLVCLDTTVYTKDFPCIDVCITVGSAGDECWHLGQITPVTNDIMLPSFCQVAVHEPCNSILWKSSLNHFSCKYLFDVAPYIPNDTSTSWGTVPVETTSLPNILILQCYIPNDVLHPGGMVVLKVMELRGISVTFSGESSLEKRQNSDLCSYHISRSPFSQLT